jgi:formamidopyrimidine-DNA glycosylase
MFWESRENPDATKTCSKYEPRTAEEIEAQEQTIAAALNAYNAIWTRETELCPECGATVENLKQVGRSVYTRPCGHRIGQGRVPEVWK